jgi:hypothetical protein
LIIDCLFKVKPVPRAEVAIVPEATDDFIRNFLVKLNLLKTLNAFQNEWYEGVQSGKLKPEDAGTVPDIYVKNQQLNDRVKFLQLEVERFKVAAEYEFYLFKFDLIQKF